MCSRWPVTVIFTGYHSGGCFQGVQRGQETAHGLKAHTAMAPSLVPGNTHPSILTLQNVALGFPSTVKPTHLQHCSERERERDFNRKLKEVLCEC